MRDGQSNGDSLVGNVISNIELTDSSQACGERLDGAGEGRGSFGEVLVDGGRRGGGEKRSGTPRHTHGDIYIYI